MFFPWTVEDTSGDNIRYFCMAISNISILMIVCKHMYKISGVPLAWIRRIVKFIARVDRKEWIDIYRFVVVIKHVVGKLTVLGVGGGIDETGTECIMRHIGTATGGVRVRKCAVINRKRVARLRIDVDRRGV